MNDQIEMNVITLDNQEDYFVLDKIKNQNNVFVYLASKDDPVNILVRKRKIIDDEIILEELDNLDEIKHCFSLFFQKHPELLNESL